MSVSSPFPHSLSNSHPPSPVSLHQPTASKHECSCLGQTKQFQPSQPAHHRHKQVSHPQVGRQSCDCSLHRNITESQAKVQVSHSSTSLSIRVKELFSKEESVSSVKTLHSCQASDSSQPRGDCLAGQEGISVCGSAGTRGGEIEEKILGVIRCLIQILICFFGS